MKLSSPSMKKILLILAEQYFNDNGWKYFVIERDFDKVQKFSEDVNRQYLAYQNITRDWYVQNSGSQNRSCCKTWEELKKVVTILQTHSKHFDFYVDTGEFSAFCVVSDAKKLPPEQVEAILDAETQSVKTIAFISSVPEEIDASVLQVIKSRD